MAYADGELAPAARNEFEARLARDAELRRLVAEQRRIAVIAREAAPPEPLELAALSIERGGANAALFFAGRALLAVGAIWVVVWLALSCFDGVARPPIAGAAIALFSGFALLLLRARNVRRAVLHLDPYRDVRR
jgi:anti-sigma factor RsiW